MKYTFLSHLLSTETPSYGDRDKFTIKTKSSISEGDTANTSCWNFTNNHIGTHIDLPYHFDNGGRQYDDYDANSFVFENIQLVDIPCNEGVLINLGSFDWSKLNRDLDLLLIRTGFEQKRNSNEYWEAYPGISSELCKYWRKQFPNLKCVGFDFISLTSPLFKCDGKEAHLEFLKPEGSSNPILILEDMSLSHVKQRMKKIIVAPLRVENGNGGPVTIIAETG